MVLKPKCIISDAEFESAVSLVEEQKHLCASQCVVDEKDVNEFDKYWSMMSGGEWNDVNEGNEGNEAQKATKACGPTPKRNEDRDLPVNWCLICEKESCQEVDGYFVCKHCGNVGAPCINSDAEWRVFSKDEQKGDKSRCGEISTTYLSVAPHAEGTVISCKWKESEQMRNARQYHKWNSCQSSGRNLYVIFDELQRHAYKNGFNHMIVEDTKHLYKETTDYHLFRGVNRKGLYAYCLYHTCKKKNVPRSIKEISKIFGLNSHVMTKGHTAFNKVLREHEKLKDRKARKTKDIKDSVDVEPQKKPESKTESKRGKKCNKGSKIRMLAKPVDFVDRFCTQLGVSPDVIQHVHQVTADVTAKRLVSDSPSLVTSACMLIVFKYDKVTLTSADVQTVSNISHVTIDKCYKKLLVFYENLIMCLQ